LRSNITWKHFIKDSPLQSSGLLGPVTIQVEESKEKLKQEDSLIKFQSLIQISPYFEKDLL